MDKTPLPITLKGRDFDLRAAMPITLRDYRELRKRGVDLMTLELQAVEDPGCVFDLVIYLLCKTDKELVPDWFEDIALDQYLVAMEHVGEIVKASPVTKPEQDFLSSSTSSPPNTDGAATIPSS